MVTTTKTHDLGEVGGIGCMVTSNEVLVTLTDKDKGCMVTSRAKIFKRLSLPFHTRPMPAYRIGFTHMLYGHATTH
jgi:hypothetical protein